MLKNKLLSIYSSCLCFPPKEVWSSDSEIHVVVCEPQYLSAIDEVKLYPQTICEPCPNFVLSQNIYKLFVLNLTAKLLNEQEL